MRASHSSIRRSPYKATEHLGHRHKRTKKSTKRPKYLPEKRTSPLHKIQKCDRVSGGGLVIVDGRILVGSEIGSCRVRQCPITVLLKRARLYFPCTVLLLAAAAAAAALRSRCCRCLLSELQLCSEHLALTTARCGCVVDAAVAAVAVVVVAAAVVVDDGDVACRSCSSAYGALLHHQQGACCWWCRFW